MLDQLVPDIEGGRIRNQRSPPAVGVLSEITTPTTRGFAASPPLTSLVHLTAQDERGSVRKHPMTGRSLTYAQTVGKSTR
jgi:hypothetical protein